MPDVVSNTGPLIALASIGQFDLLRRLFGKILFPPAVRAEVQDETSVAALTAADWIVVQPAQDLLAVQLLREELDAGESEAIILARELDAELVLIDERAARRKARGIGLQTVGTLGVLLMAKDKGLVAGLKPLLDDLRRAGFRMSDDLYRQVHGSAGEAGDFSLHSEYHS
jgi:predicted nucleic acid-binding protein